MADLSLFQSFVSSCASLLPRLKKEEQKEAVTLFKKMLPSPMEDAVDSDQMKVDKENGEKAKTTEIKVKKSRWWTKRRSIDVFEENVEESKRQRKKRKRNPPSVKKVENSPEEIVQEIAEKTTEESSKESIEEITMEITQECTEVTTVESTEEVEKEITKEITEESKNNTETNTPKKTVESKEEDNEDDAEESVKVKVLDSIGLREAAVAEILMMRKRNALMRKRLSQKPPKRSFSRKLAKCQIEEKVEISTSTEVGSGQQNTLIETLDNNVKETLKPTDDEKIPNDDLAEILPKVQNKTAMVEVTDEIGADDEMMTKLDLHENDINNEEELRMSLEAEDVEEVGEEEPFEEQTKVGKNKEECLLEPLDKQTKKANKKVATRLQKKTRKGE